MKMIMMDYPNNKTERVGIIGIPSDWLIASVPSAKILNKLKGFKFINIPIQELYSIYDKVITKADGSLLNSFPVINERINQDERKKSEAFYLALKQLVEEYKLTSFTIRCFDLLLEYQTTGCFALSKLNDEGIIAGCEGDIVSIIGMIIATRKTGQTVWMANPSQIDIDNSQLILAHCTVPTCMTENVKLDTHFESNQGIGLIGKMQETDVTLFRLGGKRLDQKFICTGTIIPHEQNPNLCRTQIKVQIDNPKIFNQLLTNPLGNHLLVLFGKHSDILYEYLINKRL
jgi:L-fucose isomerase-like protein